MNSLSNILKSRFFRQGDLQVDHLIFPLPATWWSRFYEYAWASLFAEQEDVVLDAACGIAHPFKFLLAERCSEVYACDLDSRILSMESIKQEISRDFGEEVLQKLSEEQLRNIQFSQANLTALPYTERLFDKIFCISVLEHLQQGELRATLLEFKRTLKDDGLIILTFDYPTINLQELENTLLDVDLHFAADVTTVLPDDAIHSKLWGELYCYRAVLCKGQ